jgi:hypothetical protein
MPFDPQCLATGIGSFPHKDVERTCDLILETIPEIPIWPQLPNTNFREQIFGGMWSLEPGYFNEYTGALFLPHTKKELFPSVERLFNR